MATEEAIAAGLIDWVNSLSVAEPVYTVDDLTNGDIVWKALRALNLSHTDRLHSLTAFRTNRSIQLSGKASRRSRH
jgi:hypothetical protein